MPTKQQEQPVDAKAQEPNGGRIGNLIFSPFDSKKAKELIGVLKDIQNRLVAPKDKVNGFQRFTYRNIEDVNNAVKPLAAEHDSAVSYSSRTFTVDGWHYVESTCCLLTPFGIVAAQGYAREDEAEKGKQKAQITGSCLSYSEKYAAQALFAIDDRADADDYNAESQDGEQGQNPKQSQQPQQREGELPDGAKAQGVEYPDGPFNAVCGNCGQPVGNMTTAFVGNYQCPNCGHKSDWLVAQ